MDIREKRRHNMSVWDILLVLVVILIVANSIRVMKKRKSTGCGGGCSGCSVKDCPSKQLMNELNKK